MTICQHYMDMVGKYPLLSRAEEKELSEKILTGDEKEKQKARDILITRNLRLVVKQAILFSKKSRVSIEDLIGYGNIGLIRATKDYDATKGNRFSTYAVWWIKHNIRRGLCLDKQIIRISHNSKAHYSKYRNEIEELIVELQRIPTKNEIAERLNIRKNIANLIRLACIADAVESLGDNVFTLAAKEELVEEKPQISRKKLFEKLTEREVSIIKLRYGFIDDKKWTLEAIGKVMGISKERVRQLEKKILVKIKKNISEELLDVYT